ncbi:hypothetical protein BH09VER1_BH09VER1_03870 [soil metagenome]
MIYRISHGLANLGGLKPVLRGGAFWLLLSGAFGQEPALPPPKDPILHRVAPVGSWTTSFQYEPDTGKGEKTAPALPPDPNQIKSVTVIKVHRTYCEQTLFLSGLKEEKWTFDGAQLRKVPGTDIIVPITASTAEIPQANYSDYGQRDFPELGWISRSNYQGVQVYQGKPAYFFEEKDSNGRQLTAFLSEAQLPLFFSDQAIKRTYSYNPTPAETLKPPAEFLEVLARYKRGIEALQRHPNPP